MELSKKATGISPSLTLKIDASFKEMKQKGLDVVGFGAGEPDFDTPDYIKDAAIEAIQKGFTKYTVASGMPQLKQAVCDRYFRKYGLKYEPSQVVISNGGKHSLYNVMQALLNPGDEVIILKPYWLTYPELVKMADGVPVFVDSSEAQDFQADVADIERAVTPRTKAIIINSPSNPCGCIYSHEEKKKIAALAKKYDFMIISDEIYDELTYVESASGASIACISEDAKARTIVVNGLSKAYAMTGWRIGYTIAPAEIAKVMGSYQSQATSNPCSIAQYAGVRALAAEGDAVVKDMVKVFKERSILMHQLINEVPGISCRLPEGAFYCFVNIDGILGKQCGGEVITGSLKFAELLLEKKLTAVVPGIAFGSDNHIRLSYAISEANMREGIKRIREFVEELD